MTARFSNGEKTAPGMVITAKTLTLRPARSSDLRSLAQLLNQEILTSTASWTTEPKSEETMAKWIVERTGAGFPVLVAVEDEVCAYGSYGPFRAGGGYGKTVEHTIYVSPDHRRRGIASQLIERLVSQAKIDGHHRMIGAISADQHASVQLHQRMGFHEVGHLPEVGRKFDKWLDLVFMMKDLN